MKRTLAGTSWVLEKSIFKHNKLIDKFLLPRVLMLILNKFKIQIRKIILGKTQMSMMKKMKMGNCENGIIGN